MPSRPGTPPPAPRTIPTTQSVQVSRCSTFRIMCDVPPTAVFCSGYIECFPDMISTFSYKTFVTIPVDPVITGIIIHFTSHIRRISVHKILYINLYPASLCVTDCPKILPHMSVCMFSLFCYLLYYYYYYYYYYYVGWESMVDIATFKLLNGPGIESQRGAPIQTGPQAHTAHCTKPTGSLSLG